MDGIQADRLDNFREQEIASGVGFPVYGVTGWSGWKWLDSVDGYNTGAVWIGHATRDRQAGVLVGTLPRDTFDREFWPENRDRQEAAAMAARDQFINVLGPPMPLPENLGNAIVEHVDHQVNRHAAWKQVGWTVEGTESSAKVYEFAGAWMGISEELPHAHLVAVGVGLPPVLDLYKARGEWYGVDFAAPIRIRHLQRRPEKAMPYANESLHAEQLALVRTE
ncbi:hypothetical protein DI005_37835 [Prauserella sp. PE36]|uniref:hypothetical protein n=1 Tax=Prauserella sp. PE36 TaxID=1504709 RepID=UPI000DE5354B|nr:hypothetical protein [Prauserella sp. PE36]RBM10342.1 hypothetical protein DI005_37835 [Prauserella sp. PE36]